MRNANQALLGVAMVGLLGGSMMATTGSGSAAIGSDSVVQTPGATDVPIGTDPLPPTTQPGPTTTEPGPTTTEPGPTTTEPGPTTTEPGPTTTEPGPTTTEPGPTTTEPGPTTTEPGPTTTEPGPTTTEPGPTTTEPGPTTTEPGPTTTEPGPTTTQPGPTTTEPGPARDLCLGDLVWLDRNANGIQDSGEPGLVGVTITATYFGPDNFPGGGDDETFTTTTGPGGAWLIEGLPSGEYEVAVTAGVPAGLVPSFNGPGGGDPFRLFLTEKQFDLDFGFQYNSSIGNTVFRDDNRNGVEDLGEPGIPGVRIALTGSGPDMTLGTADDTVESDTTDLDGFYFFYPLPPGTYRVAVVQSTLPAGLVNTFDEDGNLDSSTLVDLGVADGHGTADFGYAPPAPGRAAIGDTIFLDLDSNGTQNGGEPGVSGQTVRLTAAGPDGLLGTADDVVTTTTTDANGNYNFLGLAAGTYRVTVVGGIADSVLNTADPDGGTPNSSDVTIVGRTDDLDQDFGYHAGVVRGGNTIGDTVWFDENGNGVDDAGEPRLAGVDVTVTWLGPDRELGGGDDVVQGVFTTDGGGHYLATQLPDGRFSVDVTGGVPADLVITFDPQGSTDPDGLSTVTVSGGESNLDQDFGYTVGATAPLGSIGDTVFLDRNLDGSQNAAAGEPGLPGVTVRLSSPGDATRTTTTNGDGYYLFDGLPAGDYTVKVDVTTLPPGLINSADPDAPAALGDSMSMVQLAAGETNLDQDFGYGAPAPVGQTTGVGDTVWIDTNGNGVRDALEPGIGGLQITVRSAGADGILGTADDVLTPAVTDSTGTYFVDGLPAGPTVVSYHPGDLPSGVSPSFDADGGTGPQAAVTNVVLVAGVPDRSVDFAVGGPGSMRGVVFNDHNRNGVLDPGETGVSDAVVTVTYQGHDGPIVLRVVSGRDGSWSLVDLPAGVYHVTVPGAPPRTVTVTAGQPTHVTIGVLGSGGGTGNPPPPPQQPPDTGTPRHLPDTGADPFVLLLVAMGLVLAGSAIIWSQRIAAMVGRAWSAGSRMRN